MTTIKLQTKKIQTTKLIHHRIYYKILLIIKPLLKIKTNNIKNLRHKNTIIKKLKNKTY